MAAIVVDFTLEEISDYKNKLEDTVYKAEECYAEAVSRSGKLEEALAETVEVGENNKKICEEEQNWCMEQMQAARQKIEILEGYISKILNNIRIAEHNASQEEALRRNASAQADGIRNRNVSSEAEAAARDRDLAAVRKSENAHAAKCAEYRGQIDRLRRAKEDIDREIYDLRNICSSLEEIERHLRWEQERITAAVYTARQLFEDIQVCMRKLEKSREENIHGKLGVYQAAVDRALASANEAWAHMCSLNDRGYTSYDRITVTNVGTLRVNAREMLDMLGNIEYSLKEMYGTCREYGEMIDDRIMTATLSVLDELSEQQRLLFKYIDESALLLRSFGDSLVEYCRAEVK